jgi:WD40 repeat protein
MTDYQIGGSLPFNSHSYVTREADAAFYNALSAGEFCYVLNSRQMGKSSLRVRVMQHLQASGVVCGFSDLTGIGKVDSEEKWYAGIVKALISSCKLAHRVPWRAWWQQQQDLTSPCQRLREFIEDILLVEIQAPIVIFIDEIDRVLSQDFSLDDFFALIRYFYNRRVDHPIYQRLTFALLGVATPSDLIRDTNCTCFNIGRAIHLEGFQLHEVTPLIQGLVGIVEHPEAVMQDILAWTGGQPFLTQKVCQLVVQTSRNQKFMSVKTVIRQHMIEDWESQDEPQHFRTIRDRILRDEKRSGRLLGLYQQILQHGEVIADDRPEQWELQLAGLVLKHQGKLKIYSPIYAEIFNQTWVQRQLDRLRPYAAAFSAWINSQETDESRLLRGESLNEALAWSYRKNLSELDYRFLNASQSLEMGELDKVITTQQAANLVLQQANEVLKHANQKAKQRVSLGVAVLATTLSLATGIGIWAGASVLEADQRVKTANRQVQRSEQQFQVASKQVVKEKRNLRKAEHSVKSAQIQLKEKALNVQQAQSKFNTVQTKLVRLNQQFFRDRTIAAQTIQKSRADVSRTRNQKQRVEQAIVRTNQQLSQKVKDLNIAKTIQQQAIKNLNIARKEQQEIRVGTRLERLGNTALRQFQFQQIGALLTAVKAGRELQNIVQDGRPISAYPAVSPLFALKTIVDNIHEQTQLKGHQDWVEDMQISPDGQFIVTASRDATAKIWSVEGQLLHTLTGHQQRVLTSKFSPDGQSILTASYDRTVRLWNLQGQQQLKIMIPGLDPKSVSFSPDGKSIMAETINHTVWVLSIQGQVMAKLEHSQQIWDAKFSFDGKQIITVSIDRLIRIWSLQGQLLSKFPEPDGVVMYSIVSHHGQYLITELKDRTTSFRSFLGQEVFRIPGHYRFYKFTTDGRSLMTVAVEDGTVQIWTTQGKKVASFQTGHHGPIQSVQMNQASNLIITSSADKTSKVWTNTGEQLATLFSHDGIVRSAQFHPSRSLITTLADDNTPRIWRPRSRLSTQLLGHRARIRRVSFSPNGQYIVTASDDKTAKIWNLNGNVVTTLKGHQDFIRRASFSPNGQWIVTASDDKTARVWNLQGNELVQLKGHTGKVFESRFSPDGQKILTASEDHTARLWDINGNLLAQLQGHQGAVWGAQFSLDGQHVVTASDDKTAKLWDLRGKLLATLSGHQGVVWSAQFSPNGQWIVTASNDKTARLWNRRGESIAELLGHQDVVTSAKFSPNGKWILTTSQDKTARLWTIKGTLQAELQGHYDVVNNAQFSPDSQRIVTASNDGTGKIWDIRGNLLEDLRENDGKFWNTRVIKGSEIVAFRGSAGGIWYAQFSPDGRRVVTTSVWGKAAIWPVQNLDQLLTRSCDWLQTYLKYSAAATDSDRQLCGIPPKELLQVER